MVVAIPSADVGEKKKECLTRGRLSRNEDGLLVMGWILSARFLPTLTKKPFMYCVLHRKYLQKKKIFLQWFLPPHSLIRAFTQCHLK